MKILIAYAGYNDNVINDLVIAGLPEQAEVLVLSVIEWQIFFGPAGDANAMDPVTFFDKDTHTLEEANRSTASVCQEIQLRFPLWQIDWQVHFGYPSEEVVSKVNEWQPDIVFVGSYTGSVMDQHTIGPLEHFLFGGVSNRLITKADCSIHIVRGEKLALPNPVKLLVGIYDSPESPLLVEAVTSRHWPADTQVKIVTCVDKASAAKATAYLISSTISSTREVLGEVENIDSPAKIATLEGGLTTTSLVKSGKPSNVFLQEANEWGANCIFITDKKPDKIKEYLFGTVATDLVTNAKCSVEVVRNKHY